MEVKNVIIIKNASFKHNNKYLFEGLNLEIERNTFVSVIGKNAVGKTSIAKTLLGLNPYKGYINIDGYLLNNNNKMEIRKRLSLVSNSNIDKMLGKTVYEELSISLKNLMYSKKEIDNQIKEVSKKFKLDSILDKEIKYLDTNDKVKVLICSSLLYDPKVIILDNVISNLSHIDKKLIFKVLSEYKEKHKLTIILITNDLEETLYSDRIIALTDKKILLDDTIDNIYKDDKLERLGFNLPFIVKLSHNLELYELIDKVYFDAKALEDKLWP